MRNSKFHQLRNPMRNRSKFGSDFCKWVYERCDPDFYFGNIDGIAFKKSTNILRIFEWKHPGETLTPGQRAVLPILDQIIQRAVSLGILAAGSGVYVVYGNPPFKKAMVRRIGEPGANDMTAEELAYFVACNPEIVIEPLGQRNAATLVDKNHKKAVSLREFTR
jgi:hypothetical protein